MVIVVSSVKDKDEIEKLYEVKVKIFCLCKQ